MPTPSSPLSLALALRLARGAAALVLVCGSLLGSACSDDELPRRSDDGGSDPADSDAGDEVCAGKKDGKSCGEGLHCVDERCAPNRCGDGVRADGEECDD
jgi:hypothetical protein